jgi:PAT family beta-lactamase induction signal transducer AmpG
MPRKGPHPVRFAILILPYGMAFGMVSQSLAVLATQAGIPEATFGGVIASAYFVHSFKVLWAPLVDSTLSRKTWYLISILLTAFGVVASMSMPLTVAGLGALTVVVLVSQVGLTLMCMACEGFLGLAVPDEEKGRASGWYNAAQFVANGLGGWFLLKLSDWLPARWLAGAAFGALMLPCALALIGLRVPREAEHRAKLGVALRQLVRDLLGLVKTRFALTGLVISLTPVGAGAVQNLFPATAGRWGITESYRLAVFGMTLDSHDIIGLFNGFVGAFLSGGGALVGGWLADRMPRRLAYAGAGFTMAMTGIVMALMPREPWAWIVFASIYNFFTGLAFAAFTSFVLEAIGKGAVATKYNLFTMCANFAIGYTTSFDSRALDRWGTSGMLFTDAGLTLAGCAVLVAVFLIWRKPPATSTSPAA